MIQSQKVLWFTLGFTSALAAAVAVVVFKDLCFDRQTFTQHFKAENVDIKVSYIEPPAVVGPNLISLNVSVGKPK